MLLRDNTWCPAIKDTCKGDICVCYRQMPFSQSYCHNYKVYLQSEQQEAQEKEDTDV